MPEVIADIVGVEVEEIMETLENGENYEVEATPKQQAELATPFFLLYVSDVLEGLEEEKVKEIAEKHDITDRELEIIKNYPNVNIPPEKREEIVEDVSKGMFGG